MTPIKRVLLYKSVNDAGKLRRSCGGEVDNYLYGGLYRSTFSDVVNSLSFHRETEFKVRYDPSF